MPVYHGVQYTINKRGNSYQYNVRVAENGAWKRYRKQEGTEQAAEQAVQAIIDRTQAGMEGKPPTVEKFAKPTFQRVYEMVRDRRWKGSKGERSAVANGLDCVKMIGKDTPIDRVSTETIDRMIEELKDRGLAGGTVRRKLAALSTILKYAAQRHWLDALPMIDRASAGKERKRLRYVSYEEEQLMLIYFQGDKWVNRTPGLGALAGDFFTFLMDTGMRLSEAIGLTWKFVEFDAQTGDPKYITFDYDNKGEEPRLVPCTLRVASILKARKAARPANEQRVWHDMNEDRAEWCWKQMRIALRLTYDPQTKEGDRDFVIHACRHTFASRLAMAGVDLGTIKALGGWKDLTMVLRYAHLSPKVKEDAIKRMEGNKPPEAKAG